MAAALASVVVWSTFDGSRAVRDDPISRAEPDRPPRSSRAAELADAADDSARDPGGDAPHEEAVSTPVSLRVQARPGHEIVPVRVRVLDQDGTSSMPGMRFEYWIGPDLLPVRDRRLRSASTGTDGFADLEFWRPVSSTLELAAQVTQPGWGSPVARLDVPLSEGTDDAHAELVLRPLQSSLVRGVVFDGEQGPARSGTVTVIAESGPVAKDFADERTTLAADGTFELRLPHAASFVLRADLPHGPWAVQRVKPSPAQPVIRVELHALPRGEVTGRLVDLAGRPLYSYTVQVQQAPERSGEFPWRRSTMTREDGSFSVEVEPVRPFRLAALAPGMPTRRHWALDQGLVPERNEDRTYTLPLVRLSVSARDDQGRVVRFGLDPGLEQGQSWSGQPRIESRLSVTHPPERGWIRAVGRESATLRSGNGQFDGTGSQASLAEIPFSYEGAGHRYEFIVEAGTSYSFELRGVGHLLVAQDVWVPMSDQDLEIELEPQSLGPPAPVTLALLDDAGEPFGGDPHWYVRPGRQDWRVPLAEGSLLHHMPLIWTAPPGPYTLEVEFEDESAGVGRTLFLAREIWVEPELPQRFEFDVRDAAVLETPR